MKDIKRLFIICIGAIVMGLYCNTFLYVDRGVIFKKFSLDPSLNFKINLNTVEKMVRVNMIFLEIALFVLLSIPLYQQIILLNIVYMLKTYAYVQLIALVPDKLINKYSATLICKVCANLINCLVFLSFSIRHFILGGL